MRGTLTVRCEESGLCPRNGHHMKSGPTERTVEPYFHNGNPISIMAS